MNNFKKYDKIVTILGDGIMKKDKDLTNEYSKLNSYDSKLIDILISLGLSTSLTTTTCALLPIEFGSGTVICCAGATALLTPILYSGLKRVKESLDKSRKTMTSNNPVNMLIEVDHQIGQKITNTTNLFTDEILESFAEADFTMTEDQIMHINQFIYMINSNYYEEITKTRDNMSREDLLNQIIEHITTYLKANKLDYFDEFIAAKIIKACQFIPTNLQQEMIDEFTSAKSNIAGKTSYEIIRKDIIDSINNLTPTQASSKNVDFNIYDSNDLVELILSFQDDPYYIEENLGDPKTLGWDVNFLQKIIQIIVEDHYQELIEIPDYTDFTLAASFISNAMAYALVNNCESVGFKEMINTFKAWTYIPLQTKLETLDTLFLEEDIDYSYHPYKMRNPQRTIPKQKIIPFRPLQNQKSD